MRVVRLWRQRTHSSSEVIHVVLPPPPSAPPRGVARTTLIPYYAPTGLRRAKSYRPALQATPTQLGSTRSFKKMEAWRKKRKRTERGIIVPPDITLCTVYKYCGRSFAAAAAAVDVYAFEGISVLPRARFFSSVVKLNVEGIPFRGNLGAGARVSFWPLRVVGRT